MAGAGLRQQAGRLLLVMAAISTLVVLSSGDAVAKKKPKHSVAPAPAAIAAIPLPHPTPHVDVPNSPPVPTPSPVAATVPAAAAPVAAAVAADTIGTLIADDGDHEQTAREDSDAPETVPGPTAGTPPMGTGADVPNPVGLKLALQLLDNNNPAGAIAAAYALPDRLDVKIVDWMVATGSFTSIRSDTLIDLDRQLSDWPSQGLMRTRYEQALAREQPAPQDVIQKIGARPVSDDGTLLLAAAYQALGRKDDAAALIRPYWRDDDFPIAVEQKLLASFPDLLRPADHVARMDRLLYAGDAAGALRAAKLLTPAEQALAKAVALTIKGSPKAASALSALPPAVRNDPVALYSRIQILRRQNKSEDAGRLLVVAPRDPKVLVDPDAWWVERRLVSRQLIDAGDAQLAYTVVAGHGAESPVMQAEAEFHAGWYALCYLKQPGTAQKHFAAIAAISRMPLSVSRAEYWLGRTADAAGDKAGATTHYQRAGAYPTTFYGQLALARLGARQLPIANPPAPGALALRAFQAHQFVQVIRHLEAAGYGDRATPFYKTLTDQINDPAELALLAGMADDIGNHQLALQIGKNAAARGLPVDALAFPMTAIPPSAKISSVERPVVFAIARQESAFNPEAISSAGARGLLQLMPATAKEVAKATGLPYSRDRLTADPGYNAQLGATHLGDLVDSFGGSYIMTFAAYNAGVNRVAQWVKQYGDPRDPKVDAVNWIEHIPFTETRNYVQRVMENLQVYRARLGQPALTIEADLHRGGQTTQ